MVVVGLCERCVWSRVVESGRGSQFVRCGLSDSDARFRKYPPLPVQVCDGFDEEVGDVSDPVQVER